MAIDLTRARRFSSKRGVSAAAIVVNGEDFNAVDSYIVANLPAKCIVTNVYISITVLDSTAATVTMTVRVGGVTVSAAKNIGSGGTIGTTKSSVGVPTDTAGGIALAIDIAGAAPTDATATVMVEYIQEDLVTGELTNVN